VTDFAARVTKYCSDDLDGEPLQGAILVHPPGSTLYTQYAGKKSYALGGPIGAAIASKAGGASRDGEAGRIPTKWGVLALTDRRVLWFRAKARVGIGPKPAELAVSWPRDEVEAAFDDGSIAKYPCFVLTFRDGTQAPVFADKMNHPERLAAAWGIA
jgi:hypothetical protein